ncbi:MAG: MobF family relaxase [Microbacterium sp.]|uniref:MobF family relaxase n=1 Tax=Microbacterium sp. TaxID=51671 RepID=UPI0039E42221
MRGGVILFRGTGADALRYLESDRARADEYYLEAGIALAEFTAVDAEGRVIGEVALTADEYRQWVDWTNPLTGESMGKPRLPGDGRRGSPRFAEMVVNVPKSLSVAAALHPEVSEALDAAQRDAVAEIRSWLGQHSVTRVGPRGAQEVVPVEQLETVAVSHKTSRAGDPHRHIHFQIGSRVWAAGAWRGLDTAALFRQQGAIRALGTAVLAAHPQLAQVLDAHGLTLDPVTGEVAELEPWNALMSKRGAQVARNLEKFTAEWEAAHPGVEPGPVVRARLQAKAWDHERPSKKPSTLGSEAGWLRELQDAGYTPDLPRATVQPARTLDELTVQQVASRALDRTAAGASAWTMHDVQEQVARIVTEAGVRATPDELREFIGITTRLAADDCLSILPPGAPTHEHVAHLTTLHVVAVETELRDRLAARATVRTSGANPAVREPGLDADQARAAAAVASARPLVVVEGAAGAGKTTMLGAAIRAAEQDGRTVRVVTPTKKAAEVAASELGVPTDSVAALVHAHGFRWNADGVWTRLAVGDTDSETGATYRGPAKANRLAAGERIVVDEAGMLDQDTALALLTIADEASATLALVGDRAQLPAVGRGGVFDIAAALTPRVFDLTSLHRFTDPDYAQLTLDLRAGRDPTKLFDRLYALGLVVLHEDAETLHTAVAAERIDGAAITTATNDEARELNALIHEDRVREGVVDDARTTEGSDGLSIGRGDLIQTRRNDAEVGVANRQTWIVQQVGDDGSLWARDPASGRKQQRTAWLPAEYVTEHTHLAYAATAYGVQGLTAPESHTILTDALSAAGVYVGLTRGREANRLHVVSADLGDAREQFAAALERDRADRGLREATERARLAVAGIVADGPATIVNAERARLTKLIEQAERATSKWEREAAAFATLANRHKNETDKQKAMVTAAEAEAQRVRAAVADPLIAQATADGTAVITAQSRVWEASRTRSATRGFRKRSAARALSAAIRERETAETAARQRWGSIPATATSVEGWAATVAGREADAHPRVVEQRERVADAKQKQQELAARHTQQNRALIAQAFGDRTPSSPRKLAAQWRAQVETARRDLATIEALPVAEAAQLIRDRAAQEQARREAAERALVARKARAMQLHDFTRRPPDRGPTPPSHGLGL